MEATEFMSKAVKPAEKRHEACRVVWSCSNQVALSTKKLTHYMKALSYKRTLFKTQLLTNDRIAFAAELPGEHKQSIEFAVFDFTSEFCGF